MSKALVEEFMEKIWNKKKIDAVGDYFAQDAIIHSPLGEYKTPDEMKRVVSKWITAIPDMEIEQLHLIEEDDLVVSHWECKGVHHEEIHGIRGTGRPVQYQGTTMYRFKEEKIVEYWAYIDSWTLESQLNRSN